MASASAPSFSASSFCCLRTEPTRFSRFPSVTFPDHSPQRSQSASQSFSHPFLISSRLNSSKPSGADGPPLSPDNNDDIQYELQHGFTPQRRTTGSPVFVTLPIDVVGTHGQVRRRKAMAQSLRALVTAGVEGVVMEVWWGLVERDHPRVYNWDAYLEMVTMACKCGLKIRAVMAFHQCGKAPGDPNWIPLPLWVLEEIDESPDLAYSDRFGRINMEYISLGCDVLPVLGGRSPIQAYSDFMRNFRDTFSPFLGIIITGIQVGMGPAGELRYPSCSSSKLTGAWHRRDELGDFQCYDKYMLASLNASASEVGMYGWANAGRVCDNAKINPEESEFFRSHVGSWNTPSGNFFLEWYSGMLLLHGERICREAETIFRGVEVNTSAKVASIRWHRGTQSHPSELTAGNYNASVRDGLLPIARLFSRYGFSMSCTGFELPYRVEKQTNPVSSPEGYLRQLLLAAKVCNVPMEGENSKVVMDDESFHRVLKMSNFYRDGLEKTSFSFNFVRMDKNMFEYHNWVRFTRFVKQMSETRVVRAILDPGGDTRCFSTTSTTAKSRGVYAYS